MDPIEYLERFTLFLAKYGMTAVTGILFFAVFYLVRYIIKDMRLIHSGAMSTLSEFKLDLSNALSSLTTAIQFLTHELSEIEKVRQGVREVSEGIRGLNVQGKHIMETLKDHTDQLKSLEQGTLILLERREQERVKNGS